MSYDEYYLDGFRGDLLAVLATAPKKYDHPGDPIGGTVQPVDLSRANPAFAALSSTSVMNFATALYFTVLVDQVMYTYFRSYHERFEALTRCPKWRGDCPGGCTSFIHPSVIFDVIGRGDPYGAGPSDRRLLDDVVREALPTMRREVLDFFAQHLPEVDGVEVWARCRAEPPLTTIAAPDAA